MKFLILVVLVVGASAQFFENDKVLKAKNQCALQYRACVKGSWRDNDSKWKCFIILQECQANAEKTTTVAPEPTTEPPIETSTDIPAELSTESPPTPTAETRPEEVDHRHHGHHGHHHGHRHRHHHRRRPCAKHFCKCFERMVKCFKKLHNKTMDVEPVYNETMAERMDFERKPIGGMDTDFPSFDTAQRMFESANNGSKNGSKICFHHFKRCMMRRPREEQKPDMEYGDSDVGDEDPEMDEDYEGDSQETGFGFEDKMSGGPEVHGPFIERPTGMFRGGFGSQRFKKFKEIGKKYGKMFGRKLGQKFGHKRPGMFGGMWNKMREFGRKVVGSVMSKFGRGKFDRHHHRHHHHRHHHRRPRPFFRCIVGAKFCKRRAGKSKQKMKICAKRFVMCMLYVCKRIQH